MSIIGKRPRGVVAKRVRSTVPSGFTPEQEMLCRLTFDRRTTGADLALQVLELHRASVTTRATVSELIAAWVVARNVLTILADVGFPGLKDLPASLDKAEEPVVRAASLVLVRRLLRGEATGADKHAALSALARQGPDKCDEIFDAVVREMCDPGGGLPVRIPSHG